MLDDDPTQTMLSLTMINLNHTLIEKRLEWAKRHGKVILLTAMLRLTHQTVKKHIEIAWMGHPFRPRCNSLTWQYLIITSSHQCCRAALQQFRRSVKMAQRMLCRKTKTVFLARYS